MENGEVTIIANSGEYVGLGLMTQDGRDYYHIQTIPDALEGGTLPQGTPERFEKGRVTVLRGYQWNVLLDHHNKRAALLQWHALRSEAVAAITTELTREIQSKIDQQVGAWQAANPMPGNGTMAGEPPAESNGHVPAADAEAEWHSQCHSIFGDLTCVLTANHEDLHTATHDDKDTLHDWDDETQTGVMPF